MAFNSSKIGAVNSNAVGFNTVGMSGTNMSSMFSSGPANAPIKPPKVVGPNRGDYAPPGARPVIGAPNRSDFSNPDFDAELKNQKGFIDQTRGDVRRARQGFNDPTHTSAFANLMGLADSQTSSAVDAQREQDQESASRAGYSGGFGGRGKQAALDKMKAVAGEGFAGAAQIRDEEGKQYERAGGLLSSELNTYNAAQTAMNTKFGEALANRNAQQGALDLGFLDLVQKGNLGYADARAKANELQAQLDQQYNGSLIDNAKYTQMTRSLQQEWALAQQKLKEQSREFDVGTAQGELDRQEKAREFDKNNALGFAGVNASQLATQHQIATSGRTPGPTKAQAEDTSMAATLKAQRDQPQSALESWKRAHPGSVGA